MIANFSWLSEGRLAGSGGLIHHQELVWLRRQGIQAIVSLTEHSLRREKMLLHRIDPLGFSYRHIPVVDETAPSQAQVDEFIEFVGEMASQGRAVLVHCRGGYGRTGTMLACYLVSEGWGAEKAINEVRARRPGSIVPQAQQACVAQYAKRVDDVTKVTRLIRQGWEDVAGEYAKDRLGIFGRFAGRLLDLLQPPQGSVLLDVGCGDGAVAAVFPRRSPPAAAVDGCGTRLVRLSVPPRRS